MRSCYILCEASTQQENKEKSLQGSNFLFVLAEDLIYILNITYINIKLLH